MGTNADLVRRGYEAFAVGDMATIAEILAPDIAWHISGTHALSGTFIGQEEVFAYFVRLFEVSEGTFRVSIHDILDNDEHVVVLTTSAWDKPRPFAGPEAFVWHVRDGKATECWGIQYDQAGAAASLA